MADIINTQTATEAEPTASAASTTAQEPDKTFTQADVDALIQKRLDRERKKYPSDEELAAFKTWRESQQTEQEKLANLTKERDEANRALETSNAELEQLKREKYIASKGVPADDLEYYAFKIGKMVTEDKPFEKVAEEFFKEKSHSRVRVDMTAQVGSSSQTAKTGNEEMNALIRGAFN